MIEGEWIDTKNKLPNDSKYRLVMLLDGLHICMYNEELNAWIDRENWHYRDVLFWNRIA